jgi:hypothetical protein
MDSKNLVSKVFQKKWKVDEITEEYPQITPGNSDPISTFKVMVHDINDPAEKFTAKLSGVKGRPLEEWQFILGIPTQDEK